MNTLSPEALATIPSGAVSNGIVLTTLFLSKLIIDKFLLSTLPITARFFDGTIATPRGLEPTAIL